MTSVAPKLTLLTAADIRQVHEAALTILGKTGIRVDDPGARNVFAQAIGVRANRDRFFIAGNVVEWAIKAAPAQVALYRRNGEPAFKLDSSKGRQSVFGIGVTNLYYQEPSDDRVVVLSVIDNLVKGAAGQAVQNMNLMFGVDETMGLERAGLIP